MVFLRPFQSLNLAKVRLHCDHGPVCLIALPLGVVVPVKRLVFDVACHTGFFMSFASRRIGMGSIVVNTALGKCPPATPRSHQQELRLVVLQPIANCCHMNTFPCEITVDILRPYQTSKTHRLRHSVWLRHQHSPHRGLGHSPFAYQLVSPNGVEGKINCR